MTLNSKTLRDDKAPHVNATVNWDIRKGVIKCDNCGDVEPLKDVGDVDPTVDIIDTFTELHADCKLQEEQENSQ